MFKIDKKSCRRRCRCSPKSTPATSSCRTSPPGRRWTGPACSTFLPRPEIGVVLARVARLPCFRAIKNVGDRRKCIKLAKTIVKIRRKVELEKNLSYFFKETRDVSKMIWYCNLVGLRWIDSIVCTYADHGRPLEKVGGASISFMLKMTKLWECELLLYPCTEGEPDIKGYNPQTSFPKVYLDRGGVFGRKTLPYGGNFTNDMIVRLFHSLKDTPHLKACFKFLMDFFLANKFGWLSRYQDYTFNFKKL